MQVVREPGGDRLAPADPADGLDRVGADIVGVAAQRKLELHDVRNDVRPGAAVDRAHGHDRGIDRARFPADDRLEGEDDAGREHDRILGQVRIRPVSADAVDLDRHRVDIRHGIALDQSDRPGRQARAVVERDGA